MNKLLSGERPDIAIIGAPEYTGIVRNAGRISKKLPRLERGIEKLPREYKDAAYKLINEGAPSTIRKHLEPLLSRLKNRLKIKDWGNVKINLNNIDESQENIKKIVKLACENSILPIIIGGGHNISLSTISGLIESDLKKKYGILLVDSHTDYREIVDGYIHSGVPFRYLFENYKGNIKKFVAFGLKKGKNREEHLEGLKKHDAKLIDLETIKKDKKIVKNSIEEFKDVDNYFLTMDIDAFDIKGASASYHNGLSEKIGKEIAFECGKNKKCKGFDIVEVNPLIDLDSSELAAKLILSFVEGFCER